MADTTWVDQVHRLRSLIVLNTIAMVLAGAASADRPRPVISEDRELKEIDLAAWDCRDHSEGSAKTPDGIERNRLKNRSPINLAGQPLPSMDTSSFLRYFASF